MRDHTKPRVRYKLTNWEAARKIADLILEHLSQYTVEEQERRIDAFGERVHQVCARDRKRQNTPMCRSFARQLEVGTQD